MGCRPERRFWALHPAKSVLAPGTSLKGPSNCQSCPGALQSESNICRFQPELAVTGRPPVGRDVMGGKGVSPVSISVKPSACGGLPNSSKPEHPGLSRAWSQVELIEAAVPHPEGNGQSTSSNAGGCPGPKRCSFLIRTRHAAAGRACHLSTRFPGTPKSRTGVPGQPFSQRPERQCASNAFC
jgi:hypothetical protein